MKKAFARIAIVFIAFFSIVCCHDELREDLRENDINSPGYSDITTLTRSSCTVDYLGHRYSVNHGPMTIEEARNLFSDSSLVATHRALCITPQSMEQLHELEADKSLMIFYHPFGYTLLPEPSAIEVFEKPSEEVLVSQDCQIIDNEDCDTRIIHPVYVLWPYMRSIPQDVNYEILFDAFLQQAHQDEGKGGPGHLINPPLTGYLRSYDNRLGQYKPLGNVQMEFEDVYGITCFSNTDHDGHFYLPDINHNAPLSINLINTKFAVRDSLTSNVKSIAVPSESILSTFPSNECEINLFGNFYLDVYRAAEYYFYGSNDLLDIIPTYDSLGVSIDIHAINSPGEYLGVFHNYQTPYIEIWNPYIDSTTGASSMIFGTVNHELGHATNRASTGQLQMINTAHIIKESFASFVGWYNVLIYYPSYIGTNEYLTHFICTQGRQLWVPGFHEDPYSPIFVDLYDDFNQNAQLSYEANIDTISGVPLSFIVYCSLGPTNFPTVYYRLCSGIGTYYSDTDFSTFILPYYYWI